LRAEAGKPHRRAGAVERERIGIGPPLGGVCGPLRLAPRRQ
jgi:hypothetical protein